MNSGKVALPIVPVRVRGRDHHSYVDTYALLDSGTNQSFCSEALVNSLAVAKRADTISLTTLDTEDAKVDVFIVKLNVSDMDDLKTFEINNVMTRPTINVGLASLVKQNELQLWPHLSDLHLPDIDCNEVYLVIGQDNNDLLLPEIIRSGQPGEPYAIKTPLGWVLNGPVGGQNHKRVSSHFIQTDTALQQQVDRFFKLDDMGADKISNSFSMNEQRVLSFWEKETCLVNDHYSTAIPFKKHPPELPDNRSMAEQRLQSLKRRLNKDNILKPMYTETMTDLLDKGYAEKVNESEIHRSDGYVWYLPHHPVMHPRKPDKVRIVFDCAAKYHGVCLNDVVFKGPDLTNKLIGVLLRFRQEPLAFMADIEGMFHQVHVHPHDRDSLRFLWWENNDMDKNPVEYRMTAHLFGGVWSPSCANFALKRCALDNKDFYSSETIKTVDKDFYVDDCLKSIPTEAQAVQLAGELTDLLHQGGFHLTKWISNSRALMNKIPACDRTKTLTSIDLNKNALPCEKALGVLWRVKTDTLGFDVQATSRPCTKRGLLSIMSSVYDPLGLLSPYVLKAKMLFQALCKQGCDWDALMPSDISQQWNRWLADLQELKKFHVPRCIKPSQFEISTAQLHLFADASEAAYGAVAYLNLYDAEGNVHVSLLASKARLAPIKFTSIPRLELAAAVEAVKLERMLKEELSIPLMQSLFWTDSMIAWWYIQHDDKRFKTYVANRVSFIRETSKPQQWKHIDTARNPADDVSRGFTASELINSSRWIHGPKFLRLPESHWPVQPDNNMDKFDSTDLEIKCEARVYMAQNQTIYPTDMLLVYYSTWLRLRKAVAWFRRFILWLKDRKDSKSMLTVDELKEAETAIVIYTQTKHVDFSKKGHCRSLAPVKFDDGVWRVGGRLRLANISIQAKYPAILPAHNHITRLIIHHFHSKTGHGGTERVLAEVRQSFWIIKGRSTVRSTLSRCVPCKRLKAPVQKQYMADLPKDRLTPNLPPFSYVGLDYFGPFLIKRARSEVKRYGCLFTCLATRAVHIEVAVSLETDAFLNALFRFISRRGEPKEFRSDNGSNLVGGLAELREAIKDWNQCKINKQLQKKDIKWTFNPPGASHMGGIWERQIRTVRSVLSGVMQQQRLDDDGLHTLMCIAESIVNGRPITRLSNDPNDPLPLTPNHLLLLKSTPSLPPGNFVKQDIYRRRWRQVQYLADLFWTRWVKEYLPLLQERHKWTDRGRNVKVGDIVLVKHENTPRNRWPIGLVKAVYPGDDGLVRSVQLKFVRPTCYQTVYA